MLKKLKDKYKTQAAIAKEVGVSQMAVSKWASGSTSPNRKHMIKIANILECDLGFVYSQWTSKSDSNKEG